MVTWILVIFLASLMMILQHFLHLLVGKASVALYDGMSQMPVLHLGLFVHFKNDAIGKFLFIGTQ